MTTLRRLDCSGTTALIDVSTILLDFDATAFTSDCTQTADRILGAVDDFIPYLTTHLGILPVVGSAVGLPLVQEFTQHQSAAVGDEFPAACAAASSFNATLDLVNSVVPATTHNLLREYLIRLSGVGANTGFLDLESDCGCTGKDRCSGEAEVIRLLADSILKTIDGLSSSGNAIKTTVVPLINTLLGELDGMSTTALQSSFTALRGAADTVSGVDGWSSISGPYSALLDMTTSLIKCASANVSV